ncbi:MAG: oxidoreductase, partial [Gemmatimonadetes bacterium]|nr:oxidoreductase [Gemmatimonadota bacterium]
LDGPHGAFSIDRYPAVGYVFIAGGVGITPIMSFLRTMVDREDPRPVMLIYADKVWDDVAYREELEKVKETLDLDLLYVLEEEPNEDWEGETGFIDAELLEKHMPGEEFHRFFFVCGPEPMMNSVHEGLLHHGIPEAHIQMERFALA